MSRQHFDHARGNRKTLVVGFDFGTHSSKVVCRERGRRHGRIMQFDQQADGYPLFASPSVIRQVRNKLYFGSQAFKTSGGTLYHSLKVSLLTDSKPLSAAPPEGLTVDWLVAAYLAWAFLRIRCSLVDSGYTNIFLNVAAPMTHIENPKLKARYLSVVQAAWRLSFESHTHCIEQGLTVDKMERMLRSVLSAAIESTEARHFEVLPETIAPVVSLSLDPLMKPSVYAIVDMGAGTTEFAVFHAGVPGVDQMVLCYKDKTILLGGNELQMAEQSGDASQVKAIVDRIEREYRQIWRNGYSVDAANELSKRRWKDLILVLSGGGTRHTAVDRRLRGANPVPRWPDHPTSFEVCRHVPATLELENPMSIDDGSMFAVANGLAIERKKWPVVFEPHEIEPLTAPPEPERRERRWWEEEPRPRWV